MGTRSNDKNHYNVLYRLQNTSISIVSFSSRKNHLRSALFSLCITRRPGVTDMLLKWPLTQHGVFISRFTISFTFLYFFLTFLLMHDIHTEKCLIRFRTRYPQTWHVGNMGYFKLKEFEKNGRSQRRSL